MWPVLWMCKKKTRSLFYLIYKVSLTWFWHWLQLEILKIRSILPHIFPLSLLLLLPSQEDVLREPTPKYFSESIRKCFVCDVLLFIHLLHFDITQCTWKHFCLSNAINLLQPNEAANFLDKIYFTLPILKKNISPPL